MLMPPPPQKRETKTTSEACLLCQRPHRGSDEEVCVRIRAPSVKTTTCELAFLVSPDWMLSQMIYQPKTTQALK